MDLAKSLVVFWIAISICCGCRTDGNRYSVTQLVEELENCPVWDTLPPDDQSSREKILMTLKKIAANDRETVYKAIVEYTTRHKDDDWKLGKIFILHRILFKVPSRVKRSEIQFFEGYMGRPYDNETVNPLWPLDESLNTLQGGGRYNGPPYDVLKEYSYLKAKFGYRDLNALSGWHQDGVLPKSRDSSKRN